nr:glycosyltransferase [Marinobacter sp. JH2]
MSDALDASFYELVTKRKGVFRYLELGFKTFFLLLRERPDVVFAQNPSIVLSVIVVFFKRFFGYSSVVDEHNAGLFPLDGRSKILNRISKYIVLFSDFVIVTNESLYNLCLEWGGRPVIMPDPIPYLSIDSLKEKSITNDVFRVLFVCSWADDEPYSEVLTSASELPSNYYEIRITGRPPVGVESACSDSVKLLGFVSEEDYVKELFYSDAVIVLTKREDCLNCAAYEAVAAGKPGILSDKHALREYFHSGFIFTENRSDNIRDSVKLMRSKKDFYADQILELRRSLLVRDKASLIKLKNIVYKGFLD